MTILKIYNSYYKHIPLDVFNTAVAADPTSYNQGEVVKVGNFVKWILKLYQNNSWKEGDSYETKDLLTKFIKYKSKLPIEKRDINKYNSVSELYNLIQTLEGQGVKSQKDVKKEGAEVVYEDDEWKIIIPHTKEASCIYGANTKWCTAGKNSNMFKYYNDKGRLYININKVTGDKYQFHFESSSFMDAEDKKIFPKKIGLSEGAIDYYKSIGRELYFIYDEVWSFHNEIAVVKIDGKGWNWIDTNGELVWEGDEWFDSVCYFKEGFAWVELKEKGYNYINEQGELVWDKDIWFDKVHNFDNGFAMIYIDGKGWNYINTIGELHWKEDKWFDDVNNFVNGVAIVKLEGKYNFIKLNGELLLKQDNSFEYIGNFHEGFAWVKLEGKGFNFINEKGELVYKGDKWFESVSLFDNNGIAKVKYKGDWYKLNSKGELVN